jgi:DNA-binding MarR family transcriptional regulator
MFARLAGPSHLGSLELMAIGLLAPDTLWVVEQYDHQIIRGSNDLAEQVATEIALFQNATGAVDMAAGAVLCLNPTDLRCLGRLYARGPSTAGELATACGLSRGAMTTALDRLEHAAYAKRVRGETDRRKVVVEVTPRALERMESIWGPIARAGMSQLAEFSDGQLSFLLDFLRRGRELQESQARRIRAMAERAAPKDKRARRQEQPTVA